MLGTRFCSSLHLKKNENDDSLWIKIKKELTGEREDIFIGTVYLSPYKSNYENLKNISDLFEEILAFKEKGEVIIQGDFNSRTNIDDGIIGPDKFDGSVIINDLNIPGRNSEDKVPSDHRGKELIELCKALNLVILNGRKAGDLFGKCTSFQWNGASVVDYVLTSPNKFSQIEYFKIGEYIPWVSDHCAMHYCLMFARNPSTGEAKQVDAQTKGSIYQKFYWGKNSTELFKKGMTSCDNDLKGFLEIPVLEAQEIAFSFTNIILKIAECGGIRKGKNGKGKTGNNPNWFDSDCIAAKNELKKLGKSVKHKPNEIGVRAILNEKKRKFKKLIRNKKKVYVEKTIKGMSANRKQGKLFWKYFDKLENKETTDYISSISPKKWETHFKNILGDGHEVAYPNDCPEVGPLDYEITSEELNNASYILKNGKATGLDMITNEMLKCILEVKPQILLKLYNSALQHNPVIMEWCTSLIVPIHKNGSQTNPDNYRGISLISCVNKLFSAILNKRLFNYCINKGLLSEEQLGFVPGNRTSDAHFLLHNLIQNYCHKQGKRIYSCFVDFSKAFDSIPRDILFRKLINHGINGKFLNVLKNAYSNDKCRIKIGNHLSEIIIPTRGVRQGCILSPLLFNIFLADLPVAMKSVEHE